MAGPRGSRTVLAAAVAAVLLPCAAVAAQSFRRGGTEFNAKRAVNIAAEVSWPVVVTELLHHGEINAEGSNVVVCAKSGALVPSRVLQLGPGDFCRLAFETVAGQKSYEIFYGGPPPTKAPPPWTNRDGLLLETRHFQRCNLRSLDSVRKAFELAEPFGSDYVESVYHARNPFCLKPLPFLSRYSGYLHVPSAGTYGFTTSSRDCSFLLIDGEPVVSAPGRHGPTYRARPRDRKDVRLSAGSHKFEYYHAAAGSNAMMAAFWEVNPRPDTASPKRIPGEAFRSGSIGRAAAGPVELRRTRLVPDIHVEITGDVPLPDNDLPLIGVRFQDVSPQALTLGGRRQWDFGDGQTSDQPNVDHVYLRPGIYAVKLTLKRGSRGLEMSNRVNVDRPALTRRDQKKLRKLDDYLPTLATYNPRTLDVVALRQLALAYQAKAEALEAEATDGDPAEAKKYLAAAVAAGKVAFVDQPTAPGAGKAAARLAEPAADDLYKLAGLIGPLARDRLGDSALAAKIWLGAVGRVSASALKGQAATEAADVAVNDLLQTTAAKTLLETATKSLRGKARGEAASELQRVWGDYYAATGKGDAARKAYRRAEELLGSSRGYTERTAWRGAHSRSTEEFIREGRYDRAAAQLRAWQREFPADKIDGYLTLLYARYFAGRKLYPQAIAQAEQLQAVSADSPYADQLLLVAAECEERRGRVDRALATLHGLVKDYPGSPLVPAAKKQIARLEAVKTK